MATALGRPGVCVLWAAHPNSGLRQEASFLRGLPCQSDGSLTVQGCTTHSRDSSISAGEPLCILVDSFRWLLIVVT